MFGKIVAVTLNPALDVTLWLDGCDFDEPNPCRREKTYAGGKSVNVARVLKNLRVPAELIGLIGRKNREMLTGLLEEAGITYRLIQTNGSVRENMTVMLPDGRVLKINRAGSPINKEIYNRTACLLQQKLAGVRSPLAIFAGSLPPGISAADYRTLIGDIQQCGAKAAIDTDVFTAEDLKSLAPFIVKPNCCEAKRLLGDPAMGQETMLGQMGGLSDFVEHILLSCGKDGLYYFHGGQCHHITVPKVQAVSTVGAGDSVLAGFIASLYGGKAPLEAALYAAACGTAAVTLDGTEAVTYELAQAYFEQVVCEKL